MPTLSSTLTSTLTIFVTLSSASPQDVPVIPQAIRGLTDCVQGVLLPLLANSQCNPANFPCICVELDRLRAREEVGRNCPADVPQYSDFAVNTCGNIAQIVTVTDTSSARSSAGPSTRGSVTVIPVIVTTGVPSNFTSTNVGPFSNSTATHVLPTETSRGGDSGTATPVLPTETGTGGGGGGTGGNGGNGGGGGGGGGGAVPTGEPSPGSPQPGSPEPGSPAPGSPDSTAQPASPTEGAPGPEFSGVAVSDFGNGQMAMFAGFVGMMGLAFAEL